MHGFSAISHRVRLLTVLRDDGSEVLTGQKTCDGFMGLKKNQTYRNEPQMITFR